jgi:hypothetical protein
VDPDGLFGILGPGLINVKPDQPHKPSSDDLTNADIAKILGEKPKIGKAIPGQFGAASLYGTYEAGKDFVERAGVLAQFLYSRYPVVLPKNIEDLLSPSPAEAAIASDPCLPKGNK